MFNWLRRKVTFAGSVFYRTPLPPREADFERLTDAGMIIRPITGWRNAHWAIHLVHPQWGEGDLVCMRENQKLSPMIIDTTANLTPEERDAARRGQSGVSFRMETRGLDVLHERKLALRFLHALLDEDAVIACDHISQRLWSRAALDDEVCHDADLDVSSIYTVHVVSDPSGTAAAWLHTHGLGAVEAFDFDILRPSRDLLGIGEDVLRALAFAALEGETKPSMARFELGHPRPTIRFVTAAEFMDGAAPADAALRDPRDHAEKRSIVCEPEGFRLFGRARPRPCAYFSRPLPDNMVVRFSQDSTELMARRARNTYAVFRRLHQEFQEFDLPALVKLGLPVDGGGAAEREYPWFSIKSLANDSLVGRLENSPQRIAALKQGDEGTYPVESLADWTILTPIGPIRPSSLTAARILRANADKLRTLMETARRHGDQGTPG